MVFDVVLVTLVLLDGWVWCLLVFVFWCLGVFGVAPGVWFWMGACGGFARVCLGVRLWFIASVCVGLLLGFGVVLLVASLFGCLLNLVILGVCFDWSCFV